MSTMDFVLIILAVLNDIFDAEFKNHIKNNVSCSTFRKLDFYHT